MSIQFSQFRPGDLIRAETMNQLISYLQSLDSRIAKLEGSGIGGIGPIITALVPTVAHAGDQLEIRGQNFAVPAANNIVTVAGFPIDRFVSGSSTSLVFSIPFINVSGQQQLVTVAVQTQFGTGQQQLTLLPAQTTPTGSVLFTQDPANANIGTIQPGQTYTLGFAIQSQTNIAESYQLGLTVANASGLTVDQWRAAATLLDASNQPVSTAPIQFQPYQPQTYHIRVAVPGTAAQGAAANFGLSMRSLHNDPGLSRSSDPVLLTVGQRPPVSDPRVQWTLQTPSSATPSQSNPARLFIEPGTNRQFVEIPYSGSSRANTGLVQVVAAFQVDGNFNYTYTLAPAGAPWSIQSSSPQSSLGKNANDSEVIGVVLTLSQTAPAAGNPEEATLTVRATRSPLPNSQVRDTFDSWTTLGLRGYTP